MADILAFRKLWTDVQADFAAQQKTCVFAYGAKEATKQINQGPGGANRIVAYHGKGSDFDFGQILAPRFPGRIPRRPVGTHLASFTVLTWAYVASAPNDALVQWEAAQFLFEDFYAAVRRATQHPYVNCTGGSIVSGGRERPFGLEFESFWTIEEMIPDFEAVPVSPVVPTITSDITTSLEGGTI